VALLAPLVTTETGKLNKMIPRESQKRKCKDLAVTIVQLDGAIPMYETETNKRNEGCQVRGSSVGIQADVEVLAGAQGWQSRREQLWKAQEI
jgi:hypothetical protein